MTEAHPCTLGPSLTSPPLDLLVAACIYCFCTALWFLHCRVHFITISGTCLNEKRLNKKLCTF